MTSLEPTNGSVLFLGVLLIVSGIIILKALRRFEMSVAASLFSVLLIIVGAYIPFYFLGTMLTKAVTVDSNPCFSFFFFKHQIGYMSAPFVFFESASFFVVIVALLAAVALVIATVFVIKIVINAIGRVQRFYVHYTHAVRCSFVCHDYIPNYHCTYLITRRLRN